MPPGAWWRPGSFTERVPTPTDLFAGFEGTEGQGLGTLVTRVDGIIDLDLFREDESAPNGGRKLLGKLKRLRPAARSGSRCDRATRGGRVCGPDGRRAGGR